MGGPWRQRWREEERHSRGRGLECWEGASEDACRGTRRLGKRIWGVLQGKVKVGLQRWVGGMMLLPA